MFLSCAEFCGFFNTYNNVIYTSTAYFKRMILCQSAMGDQNASLLSQGQAKTNCLLKMTFN